MFYEFRTPTRGPSSDLSLEARVITSRFEELCRKSNQLDELLDRQRTIQVPTVAPGEGTVQLAHRIRKLLGADGKPIRNLRRSLTVRGIRVFELPVPSGEFSGLSSTNHTYGPRILVNARDPFGRRHFTLAHELAHLVYQHSASLCLVSPDWRTSHTRLERAADRFAVEFLMPADPVLEDARGLSSRKPAIPEIGRLANRWRVSFEAIGYRLEELRVIEEDLTTGLLESYLAAPIRRRGPRKTTWERQLGDDYVGDALKAYRRGRISIGKLANFLGIPLRRAFRLVEQGGSGKDQ